MALNVIYEGTPASLPVQAQNPASPIFWEAGSVGMIDANGKGVVFSTSAAYGGSASSIPFGIIYDRRGALNGVSNQTYLASNPGGYGDESLFNQPGLGNDAYGVGQVIPAGTTPTTTQMNDQTAGFSNPNSRKLTMYIRGGLYGTDQFDATATYVAGGQLYAMVDGTGRVTAVSNAYPVGVCLANPDGNGVLQFKSTL